MVRVVQPAVKWVFGNWIAIPVRSGALEYQHFPYVGVFCALLFFIHGCCTVFVQVCGCGGASPLALQFADLEVPADRCGGTMLRYRLQLLRHFGECVHEDAWDASP